MGAGAVFAQSREEAREKNGYDDGAESIGEKRTGSKFEIRTAPPSPNAPINAAAAAAAAAPPPPRAAHAFASASAEGGRNFGW